ncbi:MAG: ABC transporter permease subunit [Christensenellaceae bacterium]|jgi:ABC-type phosphate transport system permease subunit|nr:ABC transporter permease subunit [Christensenellaceae bacterium]
MMTREQCLNFCFLCLCALLSLLALGLFFWPVLRLCLDAAALFLKGRPMLSGLGLNLLFSLRTLALVLLLVAPIAFFIASRSYRHAGLRGLRATLGVLSWLPAVFLGLLARLLFAEVLGKGVPAAALTLIFFVLPSLTVRFEDALRAVPKSIRQAGKMLGATDSSILFRLVAPRAAGALGRALVLCTERILGEATALLMLYGAVPEGNMLSLELYRLFSLQREDSLLLALLLALILCALRLVVSHRWDGSSRSDFTPSADSTRKGS